MKNIILSIAFILLGFGCLTGCSGSAPANVNSFDDIVIKDIIVEDIIVEDIEVEDIIVEDIIVEEIKTEEILEEEKR